MSLTLSNRMITVWPATLVIAALAALAALGVVARPAALGVVARPAALGVVARPATSLSAAPARPAPAPNPAPARELAPAAHTSAAAISQLRAVARYWTTARMRRAYSGDQVLRGAWSGGDTLGDGLRWVHGGAVTRTIGKVFFTLNGMDYVCSGSAVDSARQDVVLTAAHCTGNGSGDWATNWTFVPGYTDGAEPYGAYTARRFYVLPQWEKLAGTSSARSEEYDVAFVTVNPAAAASRAGGAAAYATGQRLGRVAGGQPVSFGGSGSGSGSGSAFGGAGYRDTYVFGYPSDPPFTGLYPNFCAGHPWRARDNAMALPCAMTAGDSGGPWLTGFSPRAGTGTIVGISTYKFGDGASTLYGTALGPDAKALYLSAERG